MIMPQENKGRGTPQGSGIDLKAWTRIILILASTLFVLQGGDLNSLPIP